MKQVFTRSTLLVVFCFLINIIHSQNPIRDRWDTLYANVNYTYQVNEQFSIRQNNNLPFESNILVYGDSVHEYNFGVSSSYLQLLDLSTNSLSAINYTRVTDDLGNAGTAVIKTNTTNLSYAFFGSKLNSTLYTHHFTVYKLNSQTSAVTSETMTFLGANDYNKGILNMGFYSPNSNHDSLIIFNHSKTGIDSVNIFKKHYNQTGFVNSHVKLPVPVQEIKKVFVFNNVLYVSGRHSGLHYLFNSTDGMTFTTNTNYAFPTANIIDMDTLNNQLYLGLYDSDGTYAILRTPDGVTFSVLTNSTGVLTSLKQHDNKIWYSLKDFNSFVNYKPVVSYLSSPTFTNVTLSIDTIGRPSNDGDYFVLQKIGTKLLLGGNYMDYSNYQYGTFFYKFIPPVSNFSVSTSTLCKNTPYTFVSQSTDEDSVRWFVDAQYYASTSNTFVTNFTTTGNHTIGLIAISGTQQDTMKYTINVYSVSVSVAGSSIMCLNSPTTFPSNVIGAIGQITYTVLAPGIGASTTTNGNIIFTATTTGNFSYELNVADANNCGNTSPTYSFNVLPNKDITGIADVASVPVAGNIILYKYEPILTKFDSLTFQPLNALGEYTFSITNANTYILKCVPSATSLQLTYAPNAISWKGANIITHGCTNNSNQNISVVPLTNIGTGPGILAGKITEGQGYQPRGSVFAPGNPIGGLSVKGGKNPGGNIIAQGKTNSAGEYTLSNFPVSLPGETYFVLVDIPGLDTNTTYHRAITTGSTQYTDLNFIVDSAKINPTQNVGVIEFKLQNGTAKVHPNPTSGLITINLDLYKDESIEIKLHDLNGKEVKTILPYQSNFNKELQIQTNLSDLQNGVYFMKLKIGETQKTIKIILTN